MLGQESKWQATGEPGRVNYLVTGIPTSPGKRAGWLCEHAASQPDLCLWTLGSSSTPAGHRPGCGCLCCGPGWSQTQLLLELAPAREWHTGSSRRPWGSEITAKVWEHGLGGTVWYERGQRLLASFPDSELLLLDGLGQRAAALSTSNGLWVVCLVWGKHKWLLSPASGCARSPCDSCWWPCLPCRDIVGSLLPTSMVPGQHSPAGAREDTCLGQGQVGLLGECFPFSSQEAQRHRLWDASSGTEVWWA